MTPATLQRILILRGCFNLAAAASAAYFTTHHAIPMDRLFGVFMLVDGLLAFMMLPSLYRLGATWPVSIGLFDAGVRIYAGALFASKSSLLYFLITNVLLTAFISAGLMLVGAAGLVRAFYRQLTDAGRGGSAFVVSALSSSCTLLLGAEVAFNVGTLPRLDVVTAYCALQGLALCSGAFIARRSMAATPSA